MAANTPTAFADPARLRSAPWLRTPAIRRVFDVLATTGAVSRAVGGAVRNTLLGQAISDVDIATAATPDQVRAAAARAGLDAIPTGLAHGTVTLVSDGVPFEVTTLRRDVATDGRHATVAFTDNWVADASRRDFTINALYCDADGTLFDPLGGAADLTPPRVRFIGDPHARIREDALRILRFFRFSAEYAQREPDGALGFETIAFDVVGLAACRARTGDLAGLSAERVRAELMKILVAPGAAGAIDAMPADGLLAAVLGTAPQGDAFLRLTGLEAAFARSPDAVLRLAALAVRGRADVTVLKRRLRLFNAEAARLAATCGPAKPDPIHEALAGRPAARRLQYRLGRLAFCDRLLLAAARDPSIATEPVRASLADAEAWPAPVLPVTGADVLALGVRAGPEIGRRLAALEAWWIDRDFIPDRAACLGELAKSTTGPD